MYSSTSFTICQHFFLKMEQARVVDPCESGAEHWQNLHLEEWHSCPGRLGSWPAMKFASCCFMLFHFFTCAEDAMSRGSCPRKSAEIRYERLERLSAKLIKIDAVWAVQVWDFYFHTFSACGSCGFRGFSGYPGSTGHWRVATSLCDTGAKLSILHIFACCILHYVVRQIVRHMILHVVHHMVWYVTRTSWRHMVSNMVRHLVSHMVCHIISRHIPSHRMHTNRRNSSDYSGPSDCIALHCIRLQHIISYAHVYGMFINLLTRPPV